MLGAKNAALPALAASLLSEEPVLLDGLPEVADVRTMLRLLTEMGVSWARRGRSVEVAAANIRKPVAPGEIVRTMRASSLVLGPLLARVGRARVSLPGGCAIGARPIDYHLAGLTALGASFRHDHGVIEAVAPRGLTGRRYRFPRVSVTGTADLMMAATLARGTTVLENAAREPEVADLAGLLNAMGAEVRGAGTGTLRIVGRRRIGGARRRIVSDRIEAGTFLIAGALVGDRLLVRGVEPGHCGALLEQLEAAGARIEPVGRSSLRVSAARPIRPVGVRTGPFPGFPTDLQAQWMALMAFAEGDAEIVETVFEDRFLQAPELGRMGARIGLDGNRATVRGAGRAPKCRLTGAEVTASDLRASASLVLAGLAAGGETIVHRVHHLDRGHERLEVRLRAVGARIERIPGPPGPR